MQIRRLLGAAFVALFLLFACSEKDTLDRLTSLPRPNPKYDNDIITYEPPQECAPGCGGAGGGGSGGGVAGTGDFVWIPPSEFINNPASGDAWTNMIAASNVGLAFGVAGANNGADNSVTLFNNNTKADMYVLARAIRWMVDSSCPQSKFDDVDHALREIAEEFSYNHISNGSIRGYVVYGGTSGGWCADNLLQIARNLPGYIIAADYLWDELPDSTQTIFMDFVEDSYTDKQPQGSDCKCDNETLKQIMEQRPNNWGTMAQGAMAAVAAFLDDGALMGRVLNVHKGWLGDTSYWAQDRHAQEDSFNYGDLWWQPDPDNPVGICGVDTVGGIEVQCGNTCEWVDSKGLLPEEMRRADLTQSAACCSLGEGKYPFDKHMDGALGGALVAAEILYNEGQTGVYSLQNSALIEAVDFMFRREADDPAEEWEFGGDDSWIPWLVNKRSSKGYSTIHNSNYGKNMDFTDWTHQ